jgi:hypothetical protein
MSRTPAVLLSLIVATTTVAGAMLGLNARPDAVREERARQFHALVGGLGFGPAYDLAECAFSFDPRLCPTCPNDVGPIPGGMVFCPHHAGAVFEVTSLERADRGTGDAVP